MKLLNYLIIIILLTTTTITFIYGCKDVLLDYTEKIPTSSSLSCIGTTPSVTFNNYQVYNIFTITPTPISIVTDLNNKIVTFKYDTTYTLKYNVGEGCTENTKTFSYASLSPPVSQYSVTEGKCSNSESFITLTNIQSTSIYTLKLTSGGDTIQLNTTNPTASITKSGQWILKDQSSGNLYPECDRVISIDQPSINYPDFKVTSSICYGNNGSIIVTSPSKYTTITLTNLLDGSLITASSVGSFTSLYSGNYLLSLSSSTCGKQSISISLDPIMPRLKFTYTDTTCPSKPKIKVSIDDPSVPSTDQYIMTINGVPSSTDNVLSPIITNENQTSLPFTFSYKKCLSSFSLPMNQPQMNLAFSIDNQENSLYDCSSTSTINTINLNYDKTVISGLNVMLVNDGTIVTPSDPTLNTYPIKTNQQLSITSSCYLNPLFVELPQPEPIINVEGGMNGIGCYENTTISIYNHLDFSSIKLVPLDSPTTPISLNTVTGQFNNIFRKSYNLVYQYCSTSIESSKLLNLATSTLTSSQYILEQIGNDIDCKTGGVPVKATFIKSDSTKLDALYSYILPNQIAPIEFKFNDQCIINLNFNPNFTSTPKYLNLNNKPIIKVNNSTCLYSNDGSISIDGNGIDIGSVIIGDQLFRKSSNGVYSGLNVGSYQVSLIYSTINSNGFCGGQRFDIGTVTIGSTDTKFMVTVNSISNANCQTNDNDGSITIENPKTFKYISIGSNVAVNGVLSNLGSGLQSVSFESLDSTCKGSFPVFVGSAGTEPTFTLNLIQPSTCYSDPSISMTSNVVGDGILSIAIFNSSDDSIQVSKVIDVNSNNLQFTNQNVIPISPGNKVLIIYSGTCAYRKTITIPLNNPSFSYSSTFDYNCVNQFENGLISSGLESNFTVVTDSIIVTPTTTTTTPTTPTTISNSPFTIHGLQSGQYSALIKWNSVCQSVLPIVTKSIKPIVPPTYTITHSPSTCLSDYNYNLQITNMGQYSSVSINNRIQDDSNGNFFMLPITSGEIIYKDKTTQCIGKINFNFDPSAIVFNNNSSLSTITTGFNKTFETCHGSCDGTLQVSNNVLNETYFHYSSISIRENSKRFLTPFKTSMTSGINYFGISTTDLLFNQIGKSNPFCIISNPISFTSYEPLLVDLDGDACLAFDNDTDLVLYTNVTDKVTNQTSIVVSYKSNSNSKNVGSIDALVRIFDDENSDLEPLPTSLSATYNLVNSNKPIVVIPSASNTAADYSNLEFGNYILTATINNRQCKRSLVKSFNLNNSTNNGFLIKLDTTNYCEAVRIVPFNMEASFNYFITNSTGVIVYQYLNKSGVVLSDYLDSDQKYTVKAVQIVSGTKTVQYQSTCDMVVQSKVCPVNNDSQIKLIVGLALGLLVAAFILVYGIYKLRERQIKKKNKEKLEENEHPQEYDDQEEEIDENYRHHNMMVEM
ncbi:hypothetical protein RB653_008264 [Dictyostelium firmibasis]|uniref:Uncharacterized protein n=1 Tax=Dictyostelium firmibasis TaxID=79012 RepID=A0AAN7TYN0_9MYCE